MAQILDPRMQIHAVGPSDADFQAYRLDVPAGDAGPNYNQEVSSDHFYLITREVITGDVTVTTFYLSKTIANIDTDWTGRAALTYVRMDELTGTL